MTHGFASRARWKTRRTFACLADIHVEQLRTLTEKKSGEQDVATALAKRVFPVPGGPYRRIQYLFIPYQSPYGTMVRRPLFLEPIREQPGNQEEAEPCRGYPFLRLQGHQRPPM